ncbi:MAG: three-Cys-motif partner protein TcmP, partial [Acidimicrobiia bacterium]|nr:three-Cys-motif partner protein TcmP [Acidimicrobiia bacterium]
MTAPQETVWSIEPHTAAKHELLKHYLNAWFPILASRERRIMFLDGFAGPGIYSDGSPGSPVIALRTLLD